MQQARSVDRILQRLSWPESRLLRRFDLDFCPGLRVATLATRPLRNNKYAKPRQAHLITRFQRIGYFIEDAINGLCGVVLGQSRAMCNPLNQIIFVH